MSKKIILVLSAVFILLIIGMFALMKVTKPETVVGEKEITISVLHGDGSEKEFTYHTDEEFLGPVLLSDGLIVGDEGEFGIFITAVDGEEIDSDNQEWWCLTKAGESVMTGADTTPIASGDCFELTLTVGY